MWTFAEFSWPDAVDRYGISTVILALVVLAVWYASRVLWRDVVIPVRDKVIVRINGFFDRMDSALAKAEVYHTSHVEAFDRQEELLFLIKDLTEGVDDKCSAIMRQRGMEPPPRRPRSRPRPGKGQQPPPVSGGTSPSTSPSSP